MFSKYQAELLETEEFELFAEGYAEGEDDRKNNAEKREMSFEMGAGYIFGFVGEIEVLNAFCKWDRFGRPMHSRNFYKSARIGAPRPSQKKSVEAHA